MKSVLSCGLTFLFAASLVATVCAQETVLRVELADPPAQVSGKDSGLATATMVVAPNTAAEIVVTGAVALDPSGVGVGPTPPESCGGTEDFRDVDEFGDPVFGCTNMQDDDGDLVADADDCDCRGVQGWSMSIRTGECFGLGRATTQETVSALESDGGLRDPDGAFEKTEVIDPNNPLNGGQGGAVSAVVLSFTKPYVLREDAQVVRLNGRMSHPELAPGEMTDPCVVSIVDPSQAGLAGSGEPVKTAVTIGGETDIPDLCGLAIKFLAEDIVVPPEAGETAYRLDIVNPPFAETDEDPSAPQQGGAKLNTQIADVSVAAAQAGVIQVEVRASIITAMEGCVEDPANCDGSEDFEDVDEFGDPIFGCSNMMDDNANGLLDADDPDCRGVQGWSASVITEPCFGLARATTNGTLGALNTDGGLRDPDGAFEKTEVVDPANNGGQEGAVTAVVLSFTKPLILEKIGTSEVLVLNGRIDASAVTAAGEMTAPCEVGFVPFDVTGLSGSGEPVKTAITVSGASLPPDRNNLAVILRGASGPQPEQPFIRSDSNDDGRTNIADPVWTISSLFRGGPEIACLKAADANDDGNVDGSDAVYTINYLFQPGGGPTPPPPFVACGADPTEDTLSCGSTANCP